MAPSHWQHGQASETDFIYVTTQTLSREQLSRLTEEIGDKRSLLVMCSAFRARNLDGFTNLTIKKIPKTVLTRCEWGKDDYSLEIKNLPVAAPEPPADAPPPATHRGLVAAADAQRVDCTATMAGKHSPAIFGIPVAGTLRLPALTARGGAVFDSLRTAPARTSPAFRHKVPENAPRIRDSHPPYERSQPLILHLVRR